MTLDSSRSKNTNRNGNRSDNNSTWWQCKYGYKCKFGECHSNMYAITIVSDVCGLAMIHYN